MRMADYQMNFEEFVNKTACHRRLAAMKWMRNNLRITLDMESIAFVPKSTSVIGPFGRGSKQAVVADPFFIILLELFVEREYDEDKLSWRWVAALALWLGCETPTTSENPQSLSETLQTTGEIFGT